eukprot:COSAG01_NODE_2907_length_6880_cov_10.488204_10_plen_66_part_00
MRSILTEIYLCHACFCHEVEDGNAPAGPCEQLRLARGGGAHGSLSSFGSAQRVKSSWEQVGQGTE